ncbi:uncharacterized protein RHO25_007081 [Cercospora beticola]|uniref:Zinc finger PHD-type domain-containing protein n=1 Tax=Cercospora beticola TaxID=122368 RepID=A0ABZ0NSD4_CERBT|nr:hypothetical protein RHO25_007081 [Cercospora beticola]CAK1362663.1 unnamed protein product [Cercospora beticola]
MPVIGNIAVQLQDSSGQAVRIFPDLEVEWSKGSKTVSCLVLATPGEPFQLVISSPSVDSLWTRVLIGDELAYRSKATCHGAVRGWLELKAAEGLWHPSREWGMVSTSPHLSSNSKSPRNIVIELTAHSEKISTQDKFCCIFKFRPLSELQKLFPWTPISELMSLPLSIANEPESEPASTTSSPPSLFIPTTRLSPSGKGECEVEILHCCGLNLYGAAPDTSTGDISHTGIINCDNEWCQVPGQAWHKSCAGMEIWEEPKELWICPTCRGMPWKQMEILAGGLGADDEGSRDGYD